MLNQYFNGPWVSHRIFFFFHWHNYMNPFSQSSVHHPDQCDKTLLKQIKDLRKHPLWTTYSIVQ